jgi:phosphatidate cytidylyltransferase
MTSVASSLTRRLLTAALLIPIVVVAVWFGSAMMVGVLLGGFVLAGAWEWAGLAKWPLPGRCAFVAALLVGIGHALITDIGLMYQWMPALSLVWWLIAVVWIVAYERGKPVDSWFRGGVARVVIGILVLGPTWIALLILHQDPHTGAAMLLTLFGVIWGADSGAYLAGRVWGRRKLAPRVSPGKTWEGVAGGIVAAMVIAVLAVWLLDLGVGPALGFVLLCAATIPVSVVGDLTESLFKRQAGAKDSGTLLPGHGGVLDRIDSLCAAAPFFVVGTQLLGIGA